MLEKTKKNNDLEVKKNTAKKSKDDFKANRSITIMVMFQCVLYTFGMIFINKIIIITNFKLFNL